MVSLTQSNFVEQLFNSLHQHGENNAFCIDDTFFTYRELAEKTAAIRQSLHSINDIYIGLVANDDLATYASILAIWLEGKCYIPLHPLQPIARCNNIIEQVGIRVVLDSSEATRYPHQYVVKTASLQPTATPQQLPQAFYPQAPAYILFTSGSTGTPKGVTISYGNVESFLRSVDQLGIRLNANDRCLQMFDLRSEEHTSELQSRQYLVCRLLLEKKQNST